MTHLLTEHVVRTERHTTFYLGCGSEDAPPIIFVHGWPELSTSWRHQLPVFAGLGLRAIAPDMRGYGRSSVYPKPSDYGLEQITLDMLELLDGIGRERAVWVGHDWGAPVVWSLASHYPDRCVGIASLCVPYIPAGFGPKNIIPLVDRALYPEADFPAGQWDYQLFYQENFPAAHRAFEANVRNTVKALFRKGNPETAAKPSRTAFVRRDGGWFGGKGEAPDVPRDPDVLTEADLARYVAALERTGFAGPDSWYMNEDANIAFAALAANGGRIATPVLFLHGAYDATCMTVGTRLADPMRAACDDLTEVVVASGHWMPQEKPDTVNAALARWLALKLPEAWGA